METAESGQPSAGPRYAPDDPTLPKPWKGLIDGNTGLSYYWNPETNVTQYEKPASSGPPQAASMPKLAQLPTPRPTQPNGFAPQPVKQNTQTTQQQEQHVIMAQGHHQVISNLDMAQDQGIQFGQFTQPPGQSRPQMIQHSGLQTSQMGQLMPQHGIQHLSQHSGQPMQQPVQQLPMHGGLQMLQQHNSQVPQPQGQQYSYHQMQYMEHQQSMHNPGLHSSQQQTQLAMQGQHIPPHQLEYQLAFQKGDKVDLTQNNQPGYPQSQFQPANSSYSQTLLAGRNSVLTHPADAFFGQAQQFSDSVSRQQPASMGQLQQTGCGFSNHQLGPSFQNHVSPSMTPNQQLDLPPVGGKMRYEHSLHLGDSNGYFANAKVEGPMMSPSQAKLAAMPVARNQQESRMGAITNQNFAPGYAGAFNSTGYSMHNAVGSPSFPSNALVRASFVPLSDNAVLLPAELYRQEHEVTAMGDNVPAPFITFEATGFPPEILRDMRSAGFLSPTPIQAQTWPIALESRDIVAIAKTGSGKTLGYLIPAFILLRKRQNNAHNGPTVLVLAPTRELATQIQEEVKKFGRSSRVSCMCLYGGVPKGPQLEGLERGADIVVATPGRLNDILEMKKIHFGQVSLLVLDEADRMLDMGFEPQIRKIVNEIPMQRQTLMYTATWPKEVRKIASDLLINPIQVNIGSVDELAANKSITQYVEVVPQMEKERRLEQILREQERGSKVIIFCSTKRLCDQLARSIGRNFGAVAIHGDKSQGERDWVLNQFRNGKSPILVATDVAARGLDIKDIRVVINYDFPTGIEDYVHRIGRTGRAGATGVSYTFFSEQDWKYAADLVKVLEGANQHVTPEVRQIALRGGPSGRDRGGMSRFGSGKGNSDELWNFGGRGYGGMRSGGFNGRGGMTDGGFSSCGGARDAPSGGRVRRNGSFSGRGNRGRGFGGHASRGRNDRRLLDHYNHVDGRGRGWGRGRVDGRKHVERSRGRSNSRSPERVRTWGYSRSRSRSRSWSRSSCRSQSWSRGSSRSYSRSCSPSPRSRSRSRSRSRRHGKVERRTESNFDKMEVPAPEFGDPESGTSPMSPVMHVDALPGSEHALDAMPANHESKEGSGFKPVA